MKIPTGTPSGDFGFRPPDPVQHTRVAFDGVDATARAVQRLGEIGFGVATRMRDEDRALARAKAGDALLARELQVKTLRFDIENRLHEGSLSFEDAEKTYADALAALEVSEVDDLDDATRVHFGTGVKRIDGAGLESIRVAARNAKQGEFRVRTDASLDKFWKLAALPDADVALINARLDALDAVGQTAYGQEWGTVKRAAAERNWTNQAMSRAMRSEKDLPATRRLESELAASDGFYSDKLETGARHAILGTVRENRARIENRNRFIAERREARAARALDEMESDAAHGVLPDAAKRSRWEKDLKGGRFDALFREREKEFDEMRALSSRPIDEQEKFILEQKAAVGKRDVSPEERARLDRQIAVVGRNIDELKNEPLVFHQKSTGEAVAPLDFSVLTAPDGVKKFGEQFAKRVEVIETMRRTHGDRVRFSPFLAGEAQAVKTLLAKAPPAEQAAIFEMLQSSSGGKLDAYRGALAQAAPDSPTLRLAGNLHVQPDKGSKAKFEIGVARTNRELAATLLEGEAILKGKGEGKSKDGARGGFPIPPENEFIEAFSNCVADAYAGRPEAYEIGRNAVLAFYVGEAANEGRVSGRLDVLRLRRAVRNVLGEVVDYNGQGRVFAPRGVDKAAFKDRVKEAFHAELKARKMPESLLEQLPRFGLTKIGETSYAVRQGRNFLVDGANNPVVIDLDPQVRK